MGKASPLHKKKLGLPWTPNSQLNALFAIRGPPGQVTRVTQTGWCPLCSDDITAKMAAQPYIYWCYTRSFFADDFNTVRIHAVTCTNK